MNKNWHIIKPYLWTDKTVFDFVRSLFAWKTIDDGTYLVYTDLLKRSMWTCYRKDKDDVIRYALSRDWLRSYGSYHIQKLVESGILNCDFIYRQGEKCYKYWVPEEIVRNFEILIFEAKMHKINLYTGAAWKSNKKKKPDSRQAMSYYDDNKNLNISPLIYQAINSMYPAPLNTENFRYYIQRIGSWLARLAGKKPFDKKKSRLYIQYNRCQKFLSVLAQDDKEFSDYKAIYKVCYTGRIYEMYGGGLQTSTPMARRYLFQCVNFIDNIDLVSSQLTALHYLTKDDRLLPIIKKIYIVSQKLGIPKKLVKSHIYGFIFSNGNKHNKGSKPLFSFAQKYGIKLTKINKMMNIIKEACDSLLSQVKPKNGVYCNLTGHVLSEKKLAEMINRKWQKTPKSKKSFILSKMTMDEYIEKEKKKKLLAYYIQGVEAYIIHSLTIKGKNPIIINNGHGNIVIRDRFEVISNQHDGLIIRGFAEDVNHALQEINKELGYKFKIEQKDIY